MHFEVVVQYKYNFLCQVFHKTYIKLITKLNNIIVYSDHNLPTTLQPCYECYCCTVRHSTTSLRVRCVWPQIQ